MLDSQTIINLVMVLGFMARESCSWCLEYSNQCFDRLMVMLPMNSKLQLNVWVFIFLQVLSHNRTGYR